MADGVEYSPEALAAAVARMGKSIKEVGTFNCACCSTVKDAKFLYSIGVYVPQSSVMTEAGEKMRVVIYAVCALCGKKSPEKLATQAERNIEIAGTMLDRGYHPPKP